VTRAGNGGADLPLPAVVVLAAAGFAVISSDHWRFGLDVFSAALLAAAALRLALPARRAGALVVRNRWLDAALLAGTGAAILVLAIVVPA
jgi:hypothetical protein